MRNEAALIPAIAALALGLAPPLAAQEPPLSAIEWLDKGPGPLVPAALPWLDEPPVANSGTVPQITVTPLASEAVRQIGLVPPSVTGLPSELWLGSDPAALISLLDDMPDLHLPAAQALLYTALLAEAQGPDRDADNGDAFTLARVDTLVQFGALDPALALIEQAGVTRDAAHFAAYFDLSLLTGAEDAACATLVAMPYLAPGYGARVFCAARRGDWNTAALQLDTGRALSLLPEAEVALLDRFLNPDLYDGAAPLRVPSDVTPLTFRLHETIGEALPTGKLARAFAVADLRDLAGWKAQLEAAERLTRSGALPDNRLLGVYTERLPAASGGIWDRVEAVQRFETALATRSPTAIAKTLPPAWNAARAAALEVSFAALFADALTGLPLSGQAAQIAMHMRFLSPDYVAAAQDPALSSANPILRGVALGDTTNTKTNSTLSRAVAAAFATTAARRGDLIDMAQTGQLGEAVLRCLTLLHAGSQGDLGALTTSLATLRGLGLEDTARRAALQVLLLERNG